MWNSVSGSSLRTFFVISGDAFNWKSLQWLMRGAFNYFSRLFFMPADTLLFVFLTCPLVDLQEEFPERRAAVSGRFGFPKETERRGLVHRWHSQTHWLDFTVYMYNNKSWINKKFQDLTIPLVFFHTFHRKRLQSLHGGTVWVHGFPPKQQISG